MTFGEGANASLLGVQGGQFTLATLAEHGLDNLISAGASSLVYDTDFADSFLRAMTQSAVSLATADVHTLIGDAFADGQNGGEGGFGHVVAHAGAGCIAALAQGGDCAAGAAAGAASSMLSGYFEKNPLKVDENLPAEQQQAARLQKEQRIAELVAGLASFGLSRGEASNVHTGASIGLSAISHNRQLHIEEERLIAEFADEFAREMGWCSSEGVCSETEINKAKARLTHRALVRVDEWHALNFGDYSFPEADRFLDRLAAVNGRSIRGSEGQQSLFAEKPGSENYRNPYRNAAMLAETYELYALVDAYIDPGASPLNQAMYAMMYEKDPEAFEGAEGEIRALRNTIKAMPQAQLTEFLSIVEGGVGLSLSDGTGASEFLKAAQENPNFEAAYQAVLNPPTGEDILALAREITERRLNGDPLSEEELTLLTLAPMAVATGLASKAGRVNKVLARAYNRVKDRYGTRPSKTTDGGATNRTGTVWDNVTATADNLPNTQIPATFKLTSGNTEFYVNSNATKHMGEYLQRSSNPINDQQLLSSFSGAVDNIASSGSIKFNQVYNVDGWEIIFNQRVGDQLPVIKHALYRP